MNAAVQSTLPSTVSALRAAIAGRLRAAEIEDAELEARVLAAHAIGVEPADLLSCSEREVDAAGAARIEEWTRRRIAGEPLARILGEKEFWSRRFALTPETLVPRPETETLVEAALAAKPDRKAGLRVLDLGLGSGALLAAILLERPHAFGIGADRSFGALVTARMNLDAIGVGERAQFVCGDWGAAFGCTFDIVLANPPYIATGDLDALPREVREHDPRLALDGGADGLDAYRAICSDLPRLLAAGGVAVLELGAGQEQGVAEIARDAQLICQSPVQRDLAGRPRALVLGAGGPKKTLGSTREPH